MRRLPQTLVRRQPQIIIRRQVDHFFPIEDAHRLLLAFQHAQLRRHSLRPQLFQRVRDVLQRIILAIVAVVTHVFMLELGPGTLR